MVRALLYKQGTSAYRPPLSSPHTGTSPSPNPFSTGEEAELESVPRTVDASIPVSPSTIPVSPSTIPVSPSTIPVSPSTIPAPGRLRESLQSSTRWLTKALLERHLLARGTTAPTPSAAAPVHRAQGVLAAQREPVADRKRWRLPTGLPDTISGGVRGALGAAGRARDTLAPAKELIVPRYVEVGAVALITLMAVFLRTWDLSGTPAGVHGDETEIAMEALRSIRGESLGIWTGVTLGVPAGYAHWMSLIFRIGGADITTMRLASAIPGAAIVPVGYLLVRSLFPFRVAVLSVVMLTVSLWFIVQSRIAFGGITSVFMALLAMWLIVAAAQSRRPWVAVAAGVALGLGLYSFKSFLFYFVGIWGVALLSLAASRELRRIWEIWLCLGVSVLVGAPMILFYATSDFIGSNLRNLYAVSLSDPSTWEGIPGMALQTVLLIHNAVQGNTTDGSPAIPIVPFVASMFFWAGVLAMLLFIKERRYQLLLAAWLIGMAPVLIVPGAEGRRYLLGIFFVLVIVSVGVDSLLIPLGARLRKYFRRHGLSRSRAGNLAIFSVAVLAVAFAALFATQNLRELDRWGDGGSVKWFFNYEYQQSILLLKDLGDGREVRFYSARHSFESSIRRFMLPDATGTDGSQEFGGSGELPPANEIGDGTVFVFLDKYLALADILEEEIPESERIGELVEDGTTLYLIYLVPSG